MFCSKCGTELDSEMNFCPKCGRKLKTQPSDDEEGVLRGQAKRAYRARKQKAALWIVVGCLAAVGVCFLILFLAHPRHGDSYGHSAAAKVEVASSPSVAVDLLPAAASLSEAAFDEFDISPEGVVVVRIGGSLYEMGTGKELTPPGTHAISMAFMMGSLMIVPDSTKLACVTESKVEETTDLPVQAAKLQSGGQGRLLIYGPSAEPRDDGTRPNVICVLQGVGGLKVVGASADPILAVADDGFSTYFSVGGSLFRIDVPGKPELILDLPKPGDRIVGIAVAGEVVYYSTETAVVALKGSVTVPVAAGVGGSLRMAPDGLYVLDSRQHRVYRIAVGGPSESQPAPPPAVQKPNLGPKFDAKALRPAASPELLAAEPPLMPSMDFFQIRRICKNVGRDTEKLLHPDGSFAQHVAKEPIYQTEHVTARFVDSSASNEARVQIRLADDERDAFRRALRPYLGQKVALVVDGMEFAVRKIEESNLDGTFVLPAFSYVEANEWIDMINESPEKRRALLEGKAKP